MKVYLIGFMGAGKTHWGKVLSKKMDLPFYDLDEEIVKREGRTINEIFEEHGEEYFRVKEQEVLHELTENHENAIFSCGGGAPCFFNNIDYMNEKGITVWLNTPDDILLGRLRQQKSKRPLLKDLDDAALKAFIQKKIADRRIYYSQAKLNIAEQEIETAAFIKQINHA